jgi:hypothetical protein
MKKGLIITSVIVVGIGTLGYFFTRRPKGTIIINSDGSGTAKLGNKTGTFEKGQGTMLTTWNGWSLSVSSDRRTLRRYGTTYEDGKIGQYDGGSSSVKIIHNK